ncbi:WGR domain-containing protein [Parachitinimonas caeni]|uniref:WGR domain-containing protein n=1 Tax=Parachitinimonas caeni TaxID=3031301 RepID=A0ABT7E4W5_9NEIS|nr:WGR domain-containing protein [Parachitinimonas caeni]MDK2126490.1 WGR domain-containing protein [Parachitinimonas caeni]
MIEENYLLIIIKLGVFFMGLSTVSGDDFNSDDETIRLMRWETSERYYLAILQPDLLGDWGVYQAWGGKNSRRGNSLFKPVCTREEGDLLLNNIHRRRIKHGYALRI